MLNEFRALIAAGVTDDAELSRVTGLSLSRVQHWRLKAGYAKPTGRRRLTAEDLARAQALTEEGWPLSEIAADLGFSGYTITSALRSPLTAVNGNAWAAVQRWAGRSHATLWAEIQALKL